MVLPVNQSAVAPASNDFAVVDAIVCPVCHGSLQWSCTGLFCTDCSRKYSFRNDFPDLIVGNRFDDPTSIAKMLYEEESNADLTCNYLLPLFHQLWPKRTPAPRLLSLGCGSGVDVDLLTAEGYDCVGIDCGNRSQVWERRSQKSRLFLANGRHLPFPDDSFDGVFCGCVFPHVGVQGDSCDMTDRYREDRSQLACEMGRVLKRDGKVIVSSPNRLFPLDLFHGREEGSLRPKLNWPGHPFLLSMRDYAELFRAAGLNSVRPLPIRRYWGFIRSRHSLKGRILGLPLRVLFWSVSQFSVLRNTPVNPWLVLLIEKSK